MPITPTNQVKHAISPTKRVKSSALNAVYGQGVYGIAIYGSGNVGAGIFTNQDKSLVPTYLELQNSTPFLLENSSQLEMEGGSGALVWTNQAKN